MKHLYLFLLLPMLVFATSCRHKTCVDVVCLHNGYCNAGVCDCPEGLTGDNCETFLSCELLTPLCPPNATCTAINDTANCVCNAGFEGSLCDTLTRSFYTDGNTIYASNETCSNCPDINIDCYMVPYPPVTISNGTAPNEFIINGFGGFDSPPVNVKAYITGKNTFVVPFQTQADWGLGVKGQDNTTGTLNRNNNKITLPYIVLYADNTSDTCTVELTRQ